MGNLPPTHPIIAICNNRIQICRLTAEKVHYIFKSETFSTILRFFPNIFLIALLDNHIFKTDFDNWLPLVPQINAV